MEPCCATRTQFALTEGKYLLSQRLATRADILVNSCCGTIGKCGYGPEFCGSGNCTSNCDALAMCGPYGDLTYNDGKCGMGLCCGYYGWCGVSLISSCLVASFRRGITTY
jgi:hypothetical protein